MKTIICLIATILLTSSANDPDLFPDVEGWKKTDVQIFEADNLWDYINGAAESYHAYDFEVLYLTDYTRGENEYVTVEIYDHDSPENAYGIYSAERSPDAGFLEIGAEAYQEEGILNFVKGENYVKMRSSGEEISKDEMIRIAIKVASQLKGTNMLPKTLTLFPTEGKIPHSTLFVGENFIGYSSLSDAYIADYKTNDVEFRMFVIARKSADALDELLKDYISRRTDMEMLPKGKLVTVEDPYNGKIFMLKKGNYVLGTINLEDKTIATSVLK